MSDMDILPKHVRDADAYEPPDLPALRETVERRRRCGCEKCEGCGSDRDALVNAAPALLDEVERLRLALDTWKGGGCVHDAGDGSLLMRRDELDKLKADLAAARTTAAYWKDEHNAANVEIAHLRQAFVTMEKAYNAAALDLAAAKAVLDSVSEIMPRLGRVVGIAVDRAAWLAYQERKKTE